jgi:uncharacterized membrane protein
LSDDGAHESVLLAAIGYLPLLFFMPLLLRRDDPFARFHGLQSLVLFLALFCCQVVIWTSDLVLGKILGSMLLLGALFRAVAWLIHYPAGFAVVAAYLGLVIVCILQAASRNRWQVPLLGAYAEHLGAHRRNR